MTFHVPDDILEQSGLSGQQMLLELACHLFDIGRLDLTSAARLATLDRVDFENVLRDRGIAIYRPTLSDMEDETKAIEKFRAMRRRA